MPGIDIGLQITAINNASGAIQSVGKDVKGLGDNAQATANRLKAIQVVIAGILIEKTVEWGKALIATSAEVQNLDIRMAAMAGGAQAARKIWDDLANSFAATPFSMHAIADAWTRLRTTVGNNGETTAIISAIVTDVGALGGKDENINNLSESFQRLFATGVASAREYKSVLQQTGLTLGDLAKAAGKSQTDFALQLKFGFVSAEQFTDDFIKASESKFGFFTQNLKNSVGGSFNLISNTIEKGISDLGSRTDINEHLTVFFQNLAGAIDKVMASISQKNIDDFFDWMQKLEPLVISVAKGLLNVGIAVLDIGTAVAALLGRMPQEALEMGMIGYFLFGKKGAAVLAALGAVTHNLPTNVANTAGAFDNFQKTAAAHGQDPYQALLDYNNKQNPDSPISNMFTSAAQYAGGYLFKGMHGAGDASKPALDGAGDMLSKVFGAGSNTPGGKSIFGSPEDIAAMKKALADLMGSFKGVGTTGTDANANIALAMQQATEMTVKLKDAVSATRDKIDEINFATSGDELGGNLAKLKGQGDAIQKQIDAQINSEGNLKIQTAENLALVAQLRKEKEDVNTAIDAAIAKERLVYGLQQQQFVMQQKLAQFSAQVATANINLQSNMGVATNIYQGTSAGENQLAVIQQQQQYLQSILSLRSQIKDIEIQEQAVLADPTKIAALEGTKTALQEQMTATQQAMQQLSTTGRMTQQLWKNLGSTLENDVSSGITGLLTGTETLGQALRQIFTDLISMSVKFLLQLVEMQLFGQTAQELSVATSAPVAAAMTAMWSPAAMAASIATFGAADATGAVAFETAMATSMIPFAQGGVPGLNAFQNSVVTGPTMFGLMGEAGDEAVMPLTKIGGKLGVRSEGGGGDHFHFHSVDPESNVKFFMANMNLINQGLQQRKRLNKGSRT